MLRELAQITNPSLRERMERGLVGSMIKTKANLGMGLKNEKKLSGLISLPKNFTNQSLENLEGRKFTLTASIRSGLQIS